MASLPLASESTPAVCISTPPPFQCSLGSQYLVGLMYVCAAGQRITQHCGQVSLVQNSDSAILHLAHHRCSEKTHEMKKGMKEHTTIPRNGRDSFGPEKPSIQGQGPLLA